uniref:Uncharacterized protein LOC114332998 n=1 Tax=Diabrotica virgifera virgifera TaxID=50390 RepID=A0A6P7G0K0_DIAVI
MHIVTMYILSAQITSPFRKNYWNDTKKVSGSGGVTSELFAEMPHGCCEITECCIRSICGLRVLDIRIIKQYEFKNIISRTTQKLENNMLKCNGNGIISNKRYASRV